VSPEHQLSRRALLGGSAATLGVAALGFAGGAIARPADRGGAVGRETRPFYGAHQTGLVVPPAAHARFLIWDLHPGMRRADLVRMMKVVTDDAARLTQGRAPLADAEPELTTVPAEATVTVGFGQKFVRIGGGSRAVPAWLRPVPAYDMDRLEPEYTGGDFMVLVQSNDSVTVSHAGRVFVRQLEPFGVLKNTQDGFRRAAGSVPDGHTMRNLFGQVDGTNTPRPGTPEYAKAVWGEGRSWEQPDWLAGGTGYALRRVRMDLDAWDTVDRPDREKSIGRTLDTGAPLTGGGEFDAPDFEARNVVGLPVIPDFSHMKRARATNDDEVFARRGYNYDTAGGERADAGLLFEILAWDVARQYVPVQDRLATLDMMNLWTTPVGSSVFALPPGCEAGGYLGETLLG